MLRGLGFEVPEPGPGTEQEDGPGNSAWQRAQELALRRDAEQRRN